MEHGYIHTLKIGRAELLVWFGNTKRMPENLWPRRSGYREEIQT